MHGAHNHRIVQKIVRSRHALWATKQQIKTHSSPHPQRRSDPNTLCISARQRQSTEHTNTELSRISFVQALWATKQKHTAVSPSTDHRDAATPTHSAHQPRHSTEHTNTRNCPDDRSFRFRRCGQPHKNTQQSTSTETQQPQHILQISQGKGTARSTQTQNCPKYRPFRHCGPLDKRPNLRSK